MPHVLIKYAHVLICISAGEGSRHFSAFHITCIYNHLHIFLIALVSVSDQFYQELPMVIPSLPRSHIIKETRQRLKLNSSIEVKRLPSGYFGVYRLLIPLQEAIKAQVNFSLYFAYYWFNIPIRLMLALLYIHQSS